MQVSISRFVSGVVVHHRVDSVFPVTEHLSASQFIAIAAGRDDRFVIQPRQPDPNP